MSTAHIFLVIVLMTLAFLTIPASILINMYERGTLTITRRGGLRFIKIGKINLSLSISGENSKIRTRVTATQRRETNRLLDLASQREFEYRAQVARKRDEREAKIDRDLTDLFTNWQPDVEWERAVGWNQH